VRRIRDERGASAVEFAIIASLLLLILFGTITFGLTFNRIQGLQSSAREGARLGSLSQTTVTQITSRALDSVSILNENNFKSGSNVVWCDAWTGDDDDFDTGCVLVQTKQDLSTPPDGDYLDAGEVTTWKNAGPSDPAPCNNVPQNSRKSIVVNVKYRMKIEIPFWASPQMTASGTGEFACEKGQ
jgi:Flp pilus assembly pilin Flp